MIIEAGQKWRNNDSNITVVILSIDSDNWVEYQWDTFVPRAGKMTTHKNKMSLLRFECLFTYEADQ